MADDLNTQTAAQTTDAQAQPGTEGASAQRQQTADLDSILAEFDQSTRPAPAPAPKPDAIPVEVARRVEYLENVLAKREFKEQINPVIERVRGDIPREILSNEEIQDLLDGRAARDERLKQAWIDRGRNPGAWNKIERALQQELQKKFSKLPDANATADREAVTAAVRGASSRAPEDRPLDWGGLSDGEFLEERKKRYGF